MCKYYNGLINYKCNREEYKDGFCIFHCDKKNFTEEERKEFYEEFWKEFERQEKDENLKEFDFIGFKFPAVILVSFFTEEKRKKHYKFYEEFWKEFEPQEKYLEKLLPTLRLDTPIVPFWRVEFKKSVRFTDAIFDSIADFSAATFNDSAYFEGAKFKIMANFDTTTFKKSVRFVGTEENKVFEGFANFGLSNFETPEDVEFLNVDLSKASFIHCKNIDRMGRFERIKWSEKSGWWCKRKAIYNEIINENSKEENYEYIAEIYRKLRLNFERNLRFAEAGDFYIGEMEMRRKDVKDRFKLIRWIKRNLFSLTVLYKCFSYYGERYWLPLIWSFIVVVVFSFVYFYSPNIQSPFGIQSLFDSFLISMLVFFQLPPAGINASIILEVLVAFERVLGVFFGALFVLALRRKFKKTSE